MSKQVTLFLPTFMAGGAETVMVNYANHLASKGFQVEIVVVRKEGPLLVKLDRNISVYDLNKKSLAVCLLPMIFYFIKKRPRFILSTLKEMNLYCIWANIISLNFGRLVVREANTLSAEMAEEKSLIYRFKNFLIKASYQFANKIIVLSEDMAKDAKTILYNADDKLKVIYNPVDIDKISLLACESLPDTVLPFFRRKISLVTVARLHESKGHGLLLDTMRSMVSDGYDISLVCVGDGPLYYELISKVSEYALTDYVHFTGYDSNPYRFIKNADVFILASEFEGMPNSLLEAIALGGKVACRNAPGAGPELVRNSRAGYIFDGNYLVLKDTIVELTNRNFDFLISREYIENNHSPEVIYSSYDSVLLNEI